MTEEVTITVKAGHTGADVVNMITEERIKKRTRERDFEDFNLFVKTKEDSYVARKQEVFDEVEELILEHIVPKIKNLSEDAEYHAVAIDNELNLYSSDSKKFIKDHMDVFEEFSSYETLDNAYRKVMDIASDEVKKKLKAMNE
jgi:hypothetical protein